MTVDPVQTARRTVGQPNAAPAPPQPDASSTQPTTPYAATSSFERVAGNLPSAAARSTAHPTLKAPNPRTVPGTARKTGDPATDAVASVAPSDREIMLDAGAADGVWGRLRHLIRAPLNWFTWGIGTAAKPDDPPRVTGADIRRNVLPKLHVGDKILCGTGGKVTHMLVYVGGGKVIHSMATAKTRRGKLQRVGDAIRAIFHHPAKTGVIEEPLATFFDRYYRDSYVVLRDPQLTPAEAQKGVRAIQKLVGKRYDFDFEPGNDTYYCTEIGRRFDIAAQGAGAARVGARPEHVALLLDRKAVVDPVDYLESPDLNVVVANAAAKKRYPARLAP